MLSCRECSFTTPHFLGDHLAEAHDLGVDEYLAKHPGAETASQELLDTLAQETPNRRRAFPPKPDELTVKIGALTFKVNADVPESACLPCPEEYRLPKHGKLANDIGAVLIGLWRSRSIYAWGLPGSGKDALFHYFSWATRTPAIIRQVQPGSDIESWFFSRGFDQHGTTWEEGEVLKALRDGYKTPNGERVPYMVLLSDIDRADRTQGEYMRLITDSISKRVQGPTGTHTVMPGTRIVSTANTAGSGDERGRCISANPIDASLLDRFDIKRQFHWMDWEDEGPIVQAKFPVLMERCPGVFDTMGRITRTVRDAINNEDLYAEYSHRALVSILMHAEDMVLANGNRAIPKDFLASAAKVWIDGLPDKETRLAAEKLMDPHITGGTLGGSAQAGQTTDPLANFS